jgi:thioredoxin-related protein
MLTFLTGVAQGARVDGVGQFEIPSWFKQSFLGLGDDVNEAKANNRRLFIYFHQYGCPYCAEMVNNNFHQKHVADCTRKHFDSLDINMRGSREVTDIDGKTYVEKTMLRKATRPNPACNAISMLVRNGCWPRATRLISGNRSQHNE